MISRIKQVAVQYGKNMSLYFLASLIPTLLNLVINPLIAKNMDPIDYAIVGYFSSFTSLVGPLILFYMGQYYIRNYFVFSTESRHKLRALVFKSLISFSLLLSILSYIGIHSYIVLFNKEIEFPVFPYLLLTILTIPLSGIYSLQTADYRMEKNAKKFFVVAVSFGLLNILLNVLFVVFIKWGAFGKLFAPVITNIVFFTWILIKNIDLFKVKNTWKEFCDLLKFCWPLALGAMLGYFSGGFDKTSLEALHDTTTYGVYIVGAQMAGYLRVFADSIGTTFQPDVYEAIIKGWNRRLMKVYAIQLSMILAVVVVYIIASPLIISVLTAGRYVDATPFTRVIAFSVFFSSIYYNINGYTIGKGYPKLYTITTVIGSVVIIFLMPWMISRFRFYGAAYMSSLTFIIFSLVNILLLLFVSKPNKNNQ